MGDLDDVLSRSEGENVEVDGEREREEGERCHPGGAVREEGWKTSNLRMERFRDDHK